MKNLESPVTAVRSITSFCFDRAQVAVEPNCLTLAVPRAIPRNLSYELNRSGVDGMEWGVIRPGQTLGLMRSGRYQLRLQLGRQSLTCEVEDGRVTWT